MYIKTGLKLAGGASPSLTEWGSKRSGMPRKSEDKMEKLSVSLEKIVNEMKLKVVYTPDEISKILFTVPTSTDLHFLCADFTVALSPTEFR